jgi:hypothetical protein
MTIEMVGAGGVQQQWHHRSRGTKGPGSDAAVAMVPKDGVAR